MRRQRPLATQLPEEVAISGPLQGFTIIDICRFGPGRSAAGLLADYGADAISIVEPGFSQRTTLGFPAESATGPSTARNQRSIFLNLKAEGALEVFYRLAKKADALVESNRPGVAARLGIDYDSVRRVNPSIIYCSLSGYGQHGPYRDLPAHDLNFQAVGGMLPLDSSGHPTMPAYNTADENAIWNTALAVLIGLLSRARTGKGQFIDVSFSDGAIELPPGGFGASTLRGDLPGYYFYECQDGEYITLGMVEPWFWERLCKALGREDLIPHQKPEGPFHDEVFRSFRQAFKTRPRDEWFRILQEADVPVAPLNRTTEAVVNDPHNRARGSVIELRHHSTGEKVYQPGFALRFSDTPAVLRWGLTPEGSHTQEVLRDLGYSPAEISRLAEKGVTRLVAP